MQSLSLAGALSQLTASEPDVWDYREDLQNLSTYLAEGGELGEQDALLGATSGIDTYRGEQTIRTWLHQLISKECLHRSGRHPGLIEAYLDEAVAGMPHGKAAGADLQEELELRRDALDGFAALPENYRAALLLKEGHGLTVKKTAAMMGTTPAAIRSILYRARSRWRN